MLEKLFGFNRKETTVRTEIMAGITTFLTMAYILAVNPNILSETGMDKGALFTTTVVMSALATIFMGLYAKLPLALAPGMGLNAFFEYTACSILGYSWQSYRRIRVYQRFFTDYPKPRIYKIVFLGVGNSKESCEIKKQR